MKNRMYSSVRAIVHNTASRSEKEVKERESTQAYDRIECCRVQSTIVIWDNRVMEINSAGLCGIFTC